MQLGSIVLTGGESRRMGEPKECLAWGDSTLLLHTVVTLLDCTYPVVVTARDGHQALPPLHTDCELVYDSMPGEGPLVGIEAGMQFLAGQCDATLVVGCDMPFLTAASVSWLADQLGDASGVVPLIDQHPQPLAAIYRLDLLPQVKELLAAGERRARALVELPGIRTLSRDEVAQFDPELDFLRSIDTPEDYRKALAEVWGAP